METLQRDVCCPKEKLEGNAAGEEGQQRLDPHGAELGVNVDAVAGGGS